MRSWKRVNKAVDVQVKKLAELTIRGGASQRNIPFNNKYTMVNDYTQGGEDKDIFQI